MKKADYTIKNVRCIGKDGFSLADVNLTENFDRIMQIVPTSEFYETEKELHEKYPDSISTREAAVIASKCKRKYI